MNHQKKLNNNLEAAYLSAINFTKSHYENFPVVSLFIPKELRKHIAIVYQFARQADDLADEGDLVDSLRLTNLDDYEIKLTNCLTKNFANEFWAALFNTIHLKKLTPQYFYDLLSAFKQDVVKKRYSSYNELLDYCRRSANPVGRIILELFGITNIQAFNYSDSICTALQLTNFYQDVSIDLMKGRIYIPQEDWKKYDIDEKVFELKKNNTNFISLIKYQVDRTRQLFSEGWNLIPSLDKRIRKQIIMTILGGEAILAKIEENGYNVLNQRPKLSKVDYLKIFFKTYLIK